MNQESTKDNLVWHRGPPPHVGWWNASSTQNRFIWRWWDGAGWGRACGRDTPAANAALSASRHEADPTQAVIQWNDYWPEGARVPRMVPTGPYLGLIGASPAMPAKHPGWADDLDNIVS